MNLADALSYFDRHFADKLTDPAEVARQLHAHRMEDDYITDAIRTVAAYAQFMARARKQSKAARTLAGQTILEFMYEHNGTEYGKVWYHVWKTHRRTRRASQRILDQLEYDGIYTVSYQDEPTVHLIDPCAFVAQEA